MSWIFQRTEVEEIYASGGVGEMDVPVIRVVDKYIRSIW